LKKTLIVGNLDTLLQPAQGGINPKGRKQDLKGARWELDGSSMLNDLKLNAKLLDLLRR
jgi:hypothetical protein